MSRRLKAEELRATCDPATLPFRSTAELEPLPGLIGQQRALDATTFGIEMKSGGYNLFVLGAPATGKTTSMRRLLDAAAAARPAPADWCYVHNFADPYHPCALELPAGRGRQLRGEMTRLVEECKTRVPRLFEGEAFEREKARIMEGLGRRQTEEVTRLEETARAAGFGVERTPGGLGVVPVLDGQPITHEQFHTLPEARRQRLQEQAAALEGRVEATLRQLRQNEREAEQAHTNLVRDTVAAGTRQLLREVKETFDGLAAVQAYLGKVEEDLIAHAEELRSGGGPRPELPFLPPPGAFLDRYRVNVLVDRADTLGAPVVFERNPTHGNLLGGIEHRAHFGTLVTDFTLIKSGALHRANGGYLVLEAKDVLANFMAWDSLKKALKSRALRIETPLADLQMIRTVSLAPEPIPLSVKVVLIGSPMLYYLLYALDEDFGELFKVKVDFDDSFPRTPDNVLFYARFVADACRQEALRPFAADGIARLVEQGSRAVEHQERLSARLGLLLDLVRESAYCAERDHHPLVTGPDVTRAIAQHIERVNLLEERVGRAISDGTLLLATDGEAVGQVNGISVVSTGDHAFGRPCRITARAFCGEPGVVDIEREAKLGGRVHSKGVLILTGFLAGRYARDHPLALSASIAFEQQYEEVDGDSASSAELYALLSAVAGIPLAQRIAVTGSVNQQGQIQPVGAINAKIEGFFDACRRHGLTGGQGVLIPEANVGHLMLREDVTAAVRDERFHVYAVRSVDDGLAVLSGREAGDLLPDGRYPEASFNEAVRQALARNVEQLKALRAAPGPARKE
ncbi:MAG TPA: ATP-binding protein [Candidatus Acidoferrum sp.]|nr:ATP-binding protein [Candidatus Acidoferrum sp.]